MDRIYNAIKGEGFSDLNEYAQGVYAEVLPIIERWTAQFQSKELVVLSRLDYNAAAQDTSRLNEGRWDIDLQIRDGERVIDIDVACPVDFGFKIPQDEIAERVEAFFSDAWHRLFKD